MSMTGSQMVLRQLFGGFRDNCHYITIKINCKSEIQEILITINRFDCAILHSENPLNDIEN